MKMENESREDSLQNANHCRPTVFVYIKLRLNVWADATVLQLFCYIQKIRIKENGVHYALRFLTPTK